MKARLSVCLTNFYSRDSFVVVDVAYTTPRFFFKLNPLFTGHMYFTYYILYLQQSGDSNKMFSRVRYLFLSVAFLNNKGLMERKNFKP